MDLAQRLSRIVPSPTLAMNAKAKAMKAGGVDVVSFAVGEPDFDTPAHICQAAIEAIEGGQHKYTPADGTPELKEAIRARFIREHGLDYQPQEIVATCGGKHAIYQLAQATLNPGDEVIVPAPYWVSYPPIVILAGGEPVIIPTSPESGFKVSPAQLEAAITEKTKALIINSPSNPTGAVYSTPELIALVEVAQRNDVLIWSDEIYDRLVFDGARADCVAALKPGLKERVVVLNGVSKTYAMTGWRIGYLAGPEPIARAVAKIQSQSTSNPCAIAQAAAVAALNGPETELKKMLAAFEARRRFCLDLLADLEVRLSPPAGAFYLFPDFSAYLQGEIKGSTALAEYLLEEAHVALVPGEAFGAEGFLRLSYATSEERIEEGMGRIKKALSRLG
ncbi:MAG: pyridoxal phosphate-dependent aminotransferase [Deltaproteobacteria bacterium]|nr:pyridoxal phosphate-dependent aminotransferase [Deltaproteobacteria bacterium]